MSKRKYVEFDSADEVIAWLFPTIRPDRTTRRNIKRQAIEARQVARAVRGIEWAPPLLRNGRAAR